MTKAFALIIGLFLLTVVAAYSEEDKMNTTELRQLGRYHMGLTVQIPTSSTYKPETQSLTQLLVQPTQCYTQATQ